MVTVLTAPQENEVGTFKGWAVAWTFYKARPRTTSFSGSQCENSTGHLKKKKQTKSIISKI